MHIIYLLQNSSVDSRKIGITSDLDKRLSGLPGFEVIWSMDAGDCHVARRAEDHVLFFVKSIMGMPDTHENTLSGFTETFPISEGPSNESLIELIESVVRQLS